MQAITISRPSHSFPIFSSEPPRTLQPSNDILSLKIKLFFYFGHVWAWVKYLIFVNRKKYLQLYLSFNDKTLSKNNVKIILLGRGFRGG